MELPGGTVTMVFSDIEGSTALLSRLGGRYADVLFAQRSLLRAAWQRWHGHEIGTEGDSFFVVFASATDAVSAVDQGQRALAEHPWPDGVPVRVRMGLHTGEPQRHEEGYLGLDVHRAARIAAAAHGGQVVVSDATRQLIAGRLPPGATLSDLGWHRFKDIVEPERVHQVNLDGLPDSFPPLRSLGTSSSLPALTTTLVGRDEELRRLRQMMDDSGARLTTLTGPGGSGKTRLAIALAAELEDRYPDGVYFVPLAVVTSTDVMWTTIAETLGVTGEGRAPPAFFEHLAHRRALFVLDNLEQLPTAGSVVAELLAAAPDVTVVTTTRRPLHIQGEHEWPVPPLAVAADGAAPDAVSAAGAVQLFVQHARMVRPTFRLTPDNSADVAAICARLDGLPLAIELAAARTKLLTPRALLGRLDEALGLASRDADRPSRQRTLREAIAWSYDLLEPDLQAVFRSLGVLAGGDLDAVEAVTDTGAGRDALDDVSELVDASLAVIFDGPDGEPRVRLLKTIRDFAREMLEAHDELDAACQRHARHFTALVEETAPRLRGPSPLSARDRLETELENLRQALNWSLGPAKPDGPFADKVTWGLRLVSELSWFWYVSGYTEEGRRWQELAVERAGDDHGPQLARALHGLAILLMQQGEDRRAVRLLEQSLDIYTRVGDRSRIAMETNSLGIAYRNLGERETGRSLLEQSIAIARELELASRLATALSNLAIVEIDDGRPEEAVALLQEALTLDRGEQNVWGIAVDQANLVMALLRSHRLDEAHKQLDEMAPGAAALGDVELTINLVELFAAVYAEERELTLAARLLGASNAMREQAGMPIEPLDADHLEQSLGPARRAADPEAWARDVQAGRSLSAEDAVTEATRR